LLRIWEQELAALGASHQQTPAGRQEVATLKQTRRWLRPLWKKIENAMVGEQWSHFVEILAALRERNYSLANGWYIRLSVGALPCRVLLRRW
jgi:hypothetical protein